MQRMRRSVPVVLLSRATLRAIALATAVAALAACGADPLGPVQQPESSTAGESQPLVRAGRSLDVGTYGGNGMAGRNPIED